MAWCAGAQTPDEFNPVVNNQVYAVIPLPGGGTLLGGNFTTVNGEQRASIARFNADGSLDQDFRPAFGGQVYCLAFQPDRKILVGGSFTKSFGAPWDYFGRLNQDGTVDTGFNAACNGLIKSILIMDDAKIVIGGNFTQAGGTVHKGIARLDEEGRSDSSYKCPDVEFGSVYCLALDQSGRVLVGGSFSRLGGQIYPRLARLDLSGTIDPGFRPEPDYEVRSIAVQSDARLLIGGAFRTIGGGQRPYLARVNAEGKLDSAFSPNATGFVNCITLQADGAAIVAGDFAFPNGEKRKAIARINPDGLLDASFNPVVDDQATVSGLAIQEDGKVLVAGLFNTWGGEPRSYIARLNNNIAADQAWSSDATGFAWFRSGSSPELASAVFTACTNGTGWFFPTVKRVVGGWQISDAAIPSNATLRVSAWICGGQYNGSTWVEQTSVV